MNLIDEKTPIEGRWKDIGDFWWRVFKALQRLLAFSLFAVAHHFLNLLVDWIAGDWKYAGGFTRQVSFVFLLGVYGYLGWDMLAVFVPRLRGAKNETASPAAD